MPGKNLHAIKQPLGGRIGTREIEGDSEIINLADGDGLATDDKEIALRGIHLLVEQGLEGEEHIIGAHGMAVGKAQPTTKFQRVMQAIFRSFPGFR